MHFLVLYVYKSEFEEAEVETVSKSELETGFEVEI